MGQKHIGAGLKTTKGGLGALVTAMERYLKQFDNVKILKSAAMQKLILPGERTEDSPAKPFAGKMVVLGGDGDVIAHSGQCHHVRAGCGGKECCAGKREARNLGMRRVYDEDVMNDTMDNMVPPLHHQLANQLGRIILGLCCPDPHGLSAKMIISDQGTEEQQFTPQGTTHAPLALRRSKNFQNHSSKCIVDFALASDEDTPPSEDDASTCTATPPSEQESASSSNGDANTSLWRLADVDHVFLTTAYKDLSPLLDAKLWKESYPFRALKMAAHANSNITVTLLVQNRLRRCSSASSGENLNHKAPKVFSSSDAVIDIDLPKDHDAGGELLLTDLLQGLSGITLDEEFDHPVKKLGFRAVSFAFGKFPHPDRTQAEVDRCSERKSESGGGFFPAPPVVSMRFFFRPKQSTMRLRKDEDYVEQSQQLLTEIVEGAVAGGIAGLDVFHSPLEPRNAEVADCPASDRPRPLLPHPDGDGAEVADGDDQKLSEDDQTLESSKSLVVNEDGDGPQEYEPLVLATSVRHWINALPE